MVDPSLHQLKQTWHVAKDNLTSCVAIFFQNLLAIEPSACSKLPVGAENSAQSAQFIEYATKYAAAMGGAVEDAKSLAAIHPQLREMSQRLVVNGFDEAFLEVVKKAAMMTIEHIHKEDPVPSGAIAKTWSDIHSVMQISFRQDAKEPAREAPLPQLFFRGTCKLWRLMKEGQYEDMVQDGFCFAGRVLGVEITSEDGRFFLSFFDVHRTVMQRTEVGPTTPDVSIEEDTVAKMVDEAGVWWKLGFASAEDLSIFSANLSVAQDCAFSKQEQQGDSEIGAELAPASPPTLAERRQFRVWDIAGNSRHEAPLPNTGRDTWDPGPSSEQSKIGHKNQWSGRAGKEEDMEIAKMLREVLKTKEADAQQLRALQHKMDQLADQIKAAPPPIVSPETHHPTNSPKQATLDFSMALDKMDKEGMEDGGLVMSTKPPLVNQEREGAEVAGNPMSPHVMARHLLAPASVSSHGNCTPTSPPAPASAAAAPKSEEALRPYPFTDAEYVQQNDILDDGQPPVPRAICAQQHLEILVLIGEAKHLPRPRNQEDKSHYCAELVCSDEGTKTDVRRGNPVQGCQWFHRMSVNVNESELELARDARILGEDGPALTVHLLDCGRYAGKDVIGSSKILIKDLLELPEAGMSTECVMIKDGEEVRGTDGQRTSISIAFRSLLSNASNEWSPPTLDKTLLTCEGKITLNPARNKQVSFAQVQEEGAGAAAMVPRLSSGEFLSTLGLGGKSSLTAHEEEAIPLALEWDQEKGPEDEEEEDQQIDFYWREKLEGLMDSLCVNVIVIILVTVDIMNILLFTFIFPTEDGKEPTTQVALSATVVCFFVVELTLRQLAMGNRFWRNKWNIFDCIIVWLSASIIIFKYVVDSGGGLKGFQAVVILRIISRIAVGLRVARVLINLRRARKLSGHVRSKLRTTVSQNKRRFKKQGFDLDLTYITSRIIAMATPAFGQHGVYRNDIHVVSRFLSFRHYGCFFVFNLCDTFVSSDGVTGNYNPNMLFNQVQRIPFEDHGPPLLSEILQFCEEAQKWTLKDKRNVIAVHCKGGKGRSGVMISCFILWSGHRKSALDALELFTFRRTENYDPELGLDGTYNHYIRRGPCNQTVEGPSQIRYVHYLEAVLYSGIEPFAINKVHLTHMTIPICAQLAKRNWHISYTVKCVRAPVFNSTNGATELSRLGGRVGDSVTLNLDLIAWGDTRIEVFRHQNRNPSSVKKLVAFVIFNPAFYPDRSTIVFQKSKIDVMNKDKGNKLTAEDFSITLHIAPNSEGSEMMRIEEEMREIFLRAGRRITYNKGDEVISEDATQHRLLLITAGAVESFVYETPDANSVHALGRSASEACSLGNVGSEYCRVPNISMLGVNAVLGAEGFLCRGQGMTVRARTPLVVYEIKKPSHHHELMREATQDSDGDAESGWTRASDLGLPEMTLGEAATFYRGLGIALGTQLARVRTESIRIGSLKAFNDRQTVLADQDEAEKLRVACINMFGLPMNEKLSVRLKCSWRVDNGRPRRVRLLLFVNYIVLDPEFFGPEIGVRSELINLRQLHSVAPARSANVMVVTLLGERVHGLDIAANTIDYELAFNDQTKTRYLYSLISAMCRKAEETRERERLRPFETPLMSALLENCSSVHRLKKNEKLEEASTKSSLFLVRTGEIRLITSNGQVFRLVREGACFGEINFALNMTAGHYTAFANTPSIVLEISQHGQLQRTLEEDKALAARFYSIVAQVIEKELRETMEETFPGTWSRKHTNFSKMGPDDVGGVDEQSRQGRGGRGHKPRRLSMFAKDSFLGNLSSKSNLFGNASPAAFPSPRTPLGGRRRHSNASLPATVSAPAFAAVP